MSDATGKPSSSLASRSHTGPHSAGYGLITESIPPSPRTAICYNDVSRRHKRRHSRCAATVCTRRPHLVVELQKPGLNRLLQLGEVDLTTLSGQSPATSKRQHNYSNSGAQVAAASDVQHCRQTRAPNRALNDSPSLARCSRSSGNSTTTTTTLLASRPHACAAPQLRHAVSRLQ